MLCQHCSHYNYFSPLTFQIIEVATGRKIFSRSDVIGHYKEVIILASPLPFFIVLQSHLFIRLSSFISHEQASRVYMISLGVCVYIYVTRFAKIRLITSERNRSYRLFFWGANSFFVYFLFSSKIF